jgi:hypothetical protein
MIKPKLYESKMSDYGIPCRVRVFMNDSQIHAANETHATSLSPFKTEVTLRLVYSDGSSMTLEVEKERKTFIYRDYEKEQWEAPYHGKRWEFEDRFYSTSKSLMNAVKKSYHCDEIVFDF